MTTTGEQAETDRVAALEACAIMDTPSDEEFDFLARLAAEVCGASMAGITLIDAERQFYKSAIGMEGMGLPREQTFCQHTLTSASPLVVQDALADERFATIPLVTGAPEIRFYAGAPLRARDGEVLGALCVMGTEPRTLKPHQSELLQGLAKQVTTLVEQRRDEAELKLVRHRLGHGEVLAHVAGWEWDSVTDVATWTSELRVLLGVDDEVEGNLENFMALVHSDDRERVDETVQAALAAGGRFSFRARIVREDGQVRTMDNQGEARLDDDGAPLGMWGATVDVTEFVEAEREARESRERLEEAQFLTHVGSWEWNLGSELQVVSEQLRRILGRDSLSSQPSYEEFLDYVHPDDRATFVEVVQKALESMEPYSQVFRVITESGEVRTIESHGRIDADRSGKPVRIHGAIQDITDRERAAHELRLQADLLDQVAAGVVAAGPDRKITQWSRGAEILFGIARDHAVGRRFDQLGVIPPESQQARRVMAAQLARGEKWEGEIEFCDRTGRRCCTLATNSPVRGERDEVAGYVGVIVDLTERQNYERELGLQGHLLDQVEAAVISMDLDGRITHWNRGAEKLYGWSHDDAVGRSAIELDLVTGESGDAVTARAIEGRSWEGEVEVRRKDGTTFPAYSSNSQVRGANGSAIGYVGVSVDITDRKRAEEDARAARLETIRRLATAVERRDPETGGHIERIGDYAAMIAERLGMSPERVELIRVSSTMHDVGKVGIADDILLKPGPLTAEERAVMQTHATIGFDILVGTGADLLDLASTIALTHHERVDGKGYPNGLSGTDIPIEGRIVAVADVFDALTSDRVYRKAFSVERSIEIMEEGRGTQFDPAVLDVLLEILESFTGSGVAPTSLELAERAHGLASVAA